MRLVAVLLGCILGFPAGSSAGPSITTTALIVTNNRSQTLSRPDLRYADDDGARYLAVFRAVTAPENVILLTEFDRDSESLYPEAVSSAEPPTRANVRDAARKLASVAAAARKRGEQVEFYFVFAGHGDVDKGRGFLELSDGRIGPDDLERDILRAVSADVSHVVIDSCNSFFVINPRKVGGRRYATPKDLADGFSKRFQNVGVLLSTSAEEEVFEWSAIQSGIFSHQVRSGILGAADANRDGLVSYDEIEAFIHVSNMDVRNPAYRPKVFARGPGGKGPAALFSPRSARGRRLVFDASQLRAWVRDRFGNRVVDLHKEQGTDLEMVLPVSIGDALSVHERDTQVPDGARPEARERVVPVGEERAHVPRLTISSAPSRARGGDEIFQNVFSRPFGPMALAERRKAAKDESEPVFGISRREAARIESYLVQVGRSSRSRRILEGIFVTGAGLAMLAGGLTHYVTRPEQMRWFDWAMTGLSGLYLFEGMQRFLGTSQGERVLAEYRSLARDSRRPRDEVFARTERLVVDLARWERLGRLFDASIFFGVAAFGTIAGLNSDTSPGLQAASLVIFATSIAYGIGVAFKETTTESILRAMRTDPDLGLRIGFSPVKGGATLSLVGHF